MLRVRRLGCALLAIVLLGGFTTVATLGATLHVGSDISGAPFEYFESNSKVPLGFDIDLANAISAKLGSQVSIVNHTFDDLLAAVQRHEFDFAISAISDTGAREKRVDFVDYLVAGGGILVDAGNPLRIFSLDALCGYQVTVEAGTSYEGDLRRQSAACQAVGLGPIRILTYPTDDVAFAAFVAGVLRQRAPAPYRGAALALLAAWLCTSVFNSHFQTFAEGHLLALVLGVLLATQEPTQTSPSSVATAAATSS